MISNVKGYCIEALHVSLYKANFTSYHPRDHHVGFLFGSVLENSRKCLITFNFFTAIPNYKVTACFIVFRYTVQKEDRVTGQNRVCTASYKPSNTIHNLFAFPVAVNSSQNLSHSP